MLLVACDAPQHSVQHEEVPSDPVVKKKGGSMKVRVSARADWVTVGKVKKGETLRFKAKGQWGESPGVVRSADGGQAGIFGSGYWGVRRVNPRAPWGALVGRIGNQSFVVGQATLIEARSDGLLQLSINDGLGRRDDNHGVLTVTMERT